MSTLCFVVRVPHYTRYVSRTLNTLSLTVNAISCRCGQVFVEDVSRDGFVGVNTSGDVECRSAVDHVLPL